MTDSVSHYDYICFDCAGGHENRDGSCFTLHTEICDKCGKMKPLGHVRDFGLDNQLVFRNLTPLD